MKKYRFYLYRDVFLPGPPSKPEICDHETMKLVVSCAEKLNEVDR